MRVLSIDGRDMLSGIVIFRLGMPMVKAKSTFVPFASTRAVVSDIYLLVSFVVISCLSSGEGSHLDTYYQQVHVAIGQYRPLELKKKTRKVFSFGSFSRFCWLAMLLPPRPFRPFFLQRAGFVYFSGRAATLYRFPGFPRCPLLRFSRSHIYVRRA